MYYQVWVTAENVKLFKFDLKKSAIFLLNVRVNILHVES